MVYRLVIMRGPMCKAAQSGKAARPHMSPKTSSFALCLLPSLSRTAESRLHTLRPSEEILAKTKQKKKKQKEKSRKRRRLCRAQHAFLSCSRHDSFLAVL